MGWSVRSRHRRSVLTIAAAAATALLATVLLPPATVTAAPDPGEPGEPGPVAVVIDERLTPRHKALPGLERDTVRPVASLADADGVQTDFVENELVVATWDRTRLDWLIRRWSGRVVMTIASRGADVAPQYLVRVDTRHADPDRLSDSLAKLNGEKSRVEKLTVSSDPGVRLLAAAALEASEADSKFTVGVNWLTESTSIDQGSTYEADHGPAGFNNDQTAAYSPNAFNWSYLNSGSEQDIGVTSAWQLLDSLGKLHPQTIKVGIVDKGFNPTVNADLPPASMSTVVPFTDPDDPGPSYYPWHGTDVASSAAAVPDNFRGAAGPGGPVSSLALVYAGPDYFTGMFGIDRAVLLGSRIVNMSFSARVHWSLSWSVLPFDLYTWSIRSAFGVLLFGAAGNHNESVDKETCVWFVCWERHWHTPCENAGVLCVGGLARNGLGRYGDSNWGGEDVDMFAPGSVLVGPNPDQSLPSHAHEFTGTSAASPYAAGAAALLWSSNPGLSAGAVEAAMRHNLRSSPDSKVNNRVIHVFGALTELLPASIHIQTPSNGATLSAVTPTVFKATTFDDGHGTPVVRWRVDGVHVATGHTVSFLPSPGPHTVNATATFADGATASDSISVNVFNYPPQVHISSPSNGNAYGQTQPIPFHGTSLDDAGPLADSQVSWHLDGSPTAFATGHNPVAALNTTVGTHTVSFLGCDSFGVCASDTVTITIQPDGTNAPPQVQITNPANGSHLWVNGNDATGWYHEITLGSQVFDPEGGPVTLVWFDNGVQIATGASPTVRLRGACGIVGHHLTLQATDNAGTTTQDAVEVTVDLVC
jgi:serine protease